MAQANSDAEEDACLGAGSKLPEAPSNWGYAEASQVYAKEGFLYKRGQASLRFSPSKREQRRWFVLDAVRRELCYCKDGNDPKFRSVIPLAKVNQLESGEIEQGRFNLVCRERVYELRADTEGEAAQWMEALKPLILSVAAEPGVNSDVQDRLKPKHWGSMQADEHGEAADSSEVKALALELQELRDAWDREAVEHRKRIQSEARQEFECHKRQFILDFEEQFCREFEAHRHMLYADVAAQRHQLEIDRCRLQKEAENGAVEQGRVKRFIAKVEETEARAKAEARLTTAAGLGFVRTLENAEAKDGPEEPREVSERWQAEYASLTSRLHYVCQAARSVASTGRRLPTACGARFSDLRLIELEVPPCLDDGTEPSLPKVPGVLWLPQAQCGSEQLAQWLCAVDRSEPSAVLASAPAAPRHDREVAMRAVANDGNALEHLCREIRHDREVVLVAVRTRGHALAFAANALRDDEEVCWAAVASDGRALEYASPRLRAQKELVLAAVKSSGWAVRFAAPHLASNEEVALAAVSQNGLALRALPQPLHGNRKVVCAAIAENVGAFAFADREMRGDRGIAMEALAMDGQALRHCCAEFQGDAGCVMAAVAADGLALAWASEQLADDKAVVLAAIAQNAMALQVTSERLRADKEVVIAAVKRRIASLTFASEELQMDPEVAVAAMEAPVVKRAKPRAD